MQRVYFVGIGGIGMSALARYFAHAGLSVAGYDRTPSPITQTLTELGIRVHFDDDVTLIPPEFLDPKGTMLVYTPAIPAEHSELRHLRSCGHNPLKRAQVLGLISSKHRTLGVAGTHGKTTTSTMLAHLLGQSALGCDALVGGIAKNFGSNLLLADRGHGLLVVEADEFDRSFLTLSPHLAIITSTAPDHLDVYGSHQHVLEAFEQYAARIEPNGILLLKHGLSLNPTLAQGVSTITYGLTEQADAHPRNIALRNGLYSFDLHTPQDVITQLQLGIPARHNLENAIAASAAALLMGLQPDELRRGLASFAGVERRFDVHYRSERAVYLDDYAHHPDEIRATVQSLREAFPGRHLTGVFQPHLYSRTRDFAQGFAQALDGLDQAYLLDIYPARELPIEGVSAHSIAKLMRKPAPVLDRTALLDAMRNSPLDVLATMGAGDIDRMASALTALFERRFGPNEAKLQQERTHYELYNPIKPR
ncbi:MAG: UDP-N-acetylmuramate--L-alanine ligase [Bacteroidales bacterium]|nr:UDP-N-acetylmuramate--L-alanine ligase [Bacteroidales bacterium]